MTISEMPAWMGKYPCPNCGAGYGQCHEFALVSIMCCPDCTHPGYAAARPRPWTALELEEMWLGREMPGYIVVRIAALRREEKADAVD